MTQCTKNHIGRVTRFISHVCVCVYKQYLWKVAAGTESLHCSQAVIGGKSANMAHVHLMWGDVVFLSHTNMEIHRTACELGQRGKKERT